MIEFNTENFKEYSQFGNVETMDEVIWEYKAILEADRVATSVIELLLYLGSQSQMIPGVSWKLQETIAEALGYSVRTISNGLKTLDAYGMTARESTISNWKTPTGGAKRRKGADLVIIQANLQVSVTEQDCDSIEPDEANEDKTSDVEIKKQPSSFNHSFLKNNTLLDTLYSHPRSLRQAIPQVIYDALAPFFDADGLYKTYGLLIKAKATVDRSITVEEHGESYVDVFLNIIKKHKLGDINKLDSYLFTAWQNLTGKLAKAVSNGEQSESSVPTPKPRRRVYDAERKEIIPEWFENRNKQGVSVPNPRPQVAFNLEEEKRKLQELLRSKQNKRMVKVWN